MEQHAYSESVSIEGILAQHIPGLVAPREFRDQVSVIYSENPVTHYLNISCTVRKSYQIIYSGVSFESNEQNKVGRVRGITLVKDDQSIELIDDLSRLGVAVYLPGTSNTPYIRDARLSRKENLIRFYTQGNPGADNKNAHITIPFFFDEIGMYIALHEKGHILDADKQTDMSEVDNERRAAAYGLQEVRRIVKTLGIDKKYLEDAHIMAILGLLTRNDPNIYKNKSLRRKKAQSALKRIRRL